MKKGFVLLTVMFVFVLASSAYAAECPTSGWTNANCGCTASTLGQTYTMDNSISCSGTGINITANNVTIDCNGNSLTGDGTGTGINVGDINLWIGYNNTVIKNCEVYDFEFGIFVYLSRRPTLINNTANSNDFGIYSDYSALGTFINNTANNNTNYGISIADVGYQTITSNTASYNGQDGINYGTAGDSKFTSNTANHNGWNGISMMGTSGGNILTNNTANYNGWNGVYVEDSFMNYDNFYNTTACSNNQSGGSYFDTNAPWGVVYINFNGVETCDTSNPSGICDVSCPAPPPTCTDLDVDGCDACDEFGNPIIGCDDPCDCDDTSAARSPENDEICDDDVDNDCDELIDEYDPDCQEVPEFTGMGNIIAMVLLIIAAVLFLYVRKKK